jgi:assimilatory nitrate reductase catalytic subunit
MSQTKTLNLPLLKTAANIIRQWDGPLTQQIVRDPGGFGLGQIPRKAKPDATTTMTCGFCATGCGLNIHLQDGKAVGLSPKTEYPVNLGMACPKGWEALAVTQSDDRATTPLLKDATGKQVPVDWDTALTTFTTRIKNIMAQHGPESVAFLSTGQIACEDMALLGALAKFGMGMIHGDGNTRQCMATAVTAYKQSFGFDAPPYTYEDFEESDVMFFVGSNLCIAHPILWQRVMRNKHNPDIIVIDPRKTETAMAATHHLAISPKSDLPLLYGIANLLIVNDWIKRDYIDAHTTGFDEFAEHVKAYTPNRVAKLSGIDPDTLCTMAQKIHDGKRVSFWWTMGVNQSHEGTRVAQAMINICLMTGNIGRPGTGANSITGQCNAMGSRLFSNTTNLLGGHYFTKQQDREKVANILGIDVNRIPTQDSLPYHQIIEGVETGKIKALWFIATNPSHSWIGQNKFRDLMNKLDFLVVQDMYHNTETAQQADLVLPAAGWGEKDGTLINSERRFGLLKKVSPAPGVALADFSIFKAIAAYWGCADMFEKWTDPEAAFKLMAKLTEGQPCDITGITDYRMLDDNGGIQWPLKKGDKLQTHRRLFADGKYFHHDGKARFLFEDSQSMPELPNSEYPFVLLTGRGSAAQWHTQTRTGKSAVLRKLYPNDIYVQINPVDAQQMHIEPTQWVYVHSRRGSLKARAFVTATVAPGQVFIPMHNHETNRLTKPVFDPYSHQPSYKACAVALSLSKPWIASESEGVSHE